MIRRKKSGVTEHPTKIFTDEVTAKVISSTFGANVLNIWQSEDFLAVSNFYGEERCLISDTLDSVRETIVVMSLNYRSDSCPSEI